MALLPPAGGVEDPFGAVIPDIRLDDEPIAHDEPVHIAIVVEGAAIRPFSGEIAEAVDDRFVLARNDVIALDDAMLK